MIRIVEPNKTPSDQLLFVRTLDESEHDPHPPAPEGYATGPIELTLEEIAQGGPVVEQAARLGIRVILGGTP